MAEALLLSLIQRMEIEWDEIARIRDVETVGLAIDELRIIVDYIRDDKLGEVMRLNYLIRDLVERVNSCLDNKEPWYIREIKYVRRIAASGMLKSGVDWAGTRSGNIGEEDVDDDVVGLDEDVKMLLQRAIFSEELETKFPCITGLVGIGKTALARQIYNHASVVGQFEPRVWVRVSDNGFVFYREVLVKIIQQVVDCENQLQRDSLLEKMASANIQTLQYMLRQHLQGKRFFIVLDDIPKDVAWDFIVGVLYQREATYGCRVLITDLSRQLSNYHPTYNHKMKILDSDNSWKLFLKTIFRANKFSRDDEREVPKQLERRGKEMLTNCGGLPLAIKDVARQLAEKRRSGIEWEQLLDESIDLGPTLELLEPSYDRFDSQVKSCFLHLAFFRENTTVRVEKLKHIWLALGVITRSNVGSCLRNLIEESIIGVAKFKSTSDEFKSFRINAILHKLSIKKAEEEIGFEILSKYGKPSQIDPRHRVIICSRDKFNYSTNQDNKHLDSLFFRGGSGYLEASPSYWKSFEQLLRILDLEDFGVKILPEAIGSLKELRYLGLRNNYTQELPHSFGCLEKLEVLDIDQNFMVEVPDIIWKMKNLRHLYMSDVICQKPLKIEALQNLEVLTYISLDNWAYKLSGLQMMTYLYILGIEEVDGSSDVSKLFTSLAKLRHFQHLILRGFRFRSMPCLDELGLLHGLLVLKLDGLLPRLPSAVNFPPKLYHLKLINSCLDEDPMPVLEKLPKLRHLKLQNAYTGQQMVILHHAFPKLQVLCIQELWNLRNLQVGEGAMRYLEKIEIKYCPHLETLPKEIGSMTDHLKEIKMVTTQSIATKIRNSALISKIKAVVEINP